MSSVGPGSYEIPTTMDEHAVSIAPNGERFMENLEPGVGFYVLDELSSEKKQAEKRKSRGRALSAAAKENRAPSTLTPRAEKNILEPAAPAESEHLRRRLLEEEKRRAQAEARAADLVVAKKAAANAHAQLQSHERKIEQLQKELEDTSVARKEAHKRACDLEAERGRVKKALYEKEQQSAALQKSLVLAKAQLEERGRKLEEMGCDAEKLRLEAHQLRTRMEENKRPSTTPKKTASPTKSPAKCNFDAEEALRSLEARASAQHAETEGYLQQLAEAQESLQLKLEDTERRAARELAEAEERLEEQADELQLRREQLRYVLTESQHQEEILEAKVLVRDVTLRALVNASERGIRESNEERVKELEGIIANEREQKDAAMKAVKELQEQQQQWAEEKMQLQKEVHQAEVKHAEVYGELFTAQQVAALSRDKHQELQGQLNTTSLQAEAKKAELVAETERLRAELYEALAGRAEAHEAVAAKEARVASLNQELQELQSDLENFRYKTQEAEKRLQGQVKELESLRVVAAEAESSRALAQQQKEELEHLRQECEEYRKQSAEILESMQVSQKEMQSMVAELHSLRASDAKFESSQASEMERNAQSAGHNNHRQKIHHIINIKEDNRTLRTELKKARQKIAQLEVAAAGEVASKIGCGFASPPGRGARRLSGQTGLDQRSDRVAMEHQHLLLLLERAALNSISAPNKGAAAFLRRLGHLAQQDRSIDRSSWVSEGPRCGPQTPEKRQSLLEDLSDLGDEVPDASEVDADANQ